ncbi:4-hydroxy-tetrahydrodipicolinate synthase [Saccharibacillus sp. CPCC 101409]|uniref:4-hydroxy-tetrahydrodipicolinate synthase n=1 Tax=Saccharibacillus sp. CPCC 101409 TaxID=3058041 RepID=UPI0026733381|nr:4-hydroxy-tetrahydrodipicolinate synthase [Saccharibacillus sp. CPCC 101409]MDO3410645.1 4-hydroxy-tetrahydrodipicolinate synthase [Saccharibacillus sp. CPCC 101409]
MDFGRLITAMVTPFDGQGEVAWDRVAPLIDRLIDVQKTESIVVFGTTGESPTLTDEEKIRLLELAVKHAAGRCRIIAGTGSNDTRHSVELSQAAEAAGADGLLLVVPYYNRPNQAGLYAHFSAVAEATTLPIMLYNVPSRTASNLEGATTLKLAQLPNVVAVKECAPADQVAYIASRAPEGFRIYSGDDAASLPALSVGAYGIVSVASHVVGARMGEMLAAHAKGNAAEATRIYHSLLPVFKGLFACPHPVPNPVAVKYALTLQGFEAGGVRLPLVDATDEEKTYIRAFMRQFL